MISGCRNRLLNSHFIVHVYWYYGNSGYEPPRITNFFDAIRTNKPVVEDATFGFRAAAPALACNESYFKKKIIQWDPTNMKLL